MNLTTGARLGAYTVVAHLGAGGMGEVYRARDTRLGREVAIKVLREHAEGDADRLHRFTLEARAVAALNHPNIITIFEVADSDGVPYMVTELVEGHTLRHRIESGPVPLPQALGIAIQIAEGLAHAHDARIVHRDLKPQNVMLKSDGLVKILDFGLGKILASESVGHTSTATTLSGPRTTVGTIIGTAGYMSPEQVTGRPVDARSDQFAFGAVLYEILTGRRAFSRDTAIETISSVLSAEPNPPIVSIAPSTPAALVRIVERCLQKAPADRYASTRDLVHDLQAVRRELTETKSDARPTPALRHTWAIVVVLLSVVVIAGVITLLMIRRPSAHAEQIAVLPFANIQRDPVSDAFADGIVELLATSLTQLERSNDKLNVVPASDVRRYGVSSAKEARQFFGATLVVTGSIQRSANVIRLTLNLIDAETQKQRSARVIDARADDPLALQDQAFEILAGMLGSAVGPETRVALKTGSTTVPGAYDFFIQGRGYLQRFERVENVDSAIRMFQRAIETDDHFALAYASLGEALWRKYELTKDSSLITAARAACAKATSIDDQSASVHLTLSMIARGTGDYDTAVREATRARGFDPGSADTVRELARAYESLNRFGEAEAAYRAAIAARPGDWSGYNALGTYYYGRKMYPKAFEQFQRVAELTPDNATAYSNMGGVLFLMQRYDEALKQFERSVSLRPTSGALSNLGTLNFRLKHFSEAANAFERAAVITPNNYLLWGNLGSAYSQAGNEARSTTAYRRAVEAAERERGVNPRAADVAADLAGYYAVLGDADKARSAMKDALLLGPEDVDVMVSVAVALNTLDDSSAAIGWLLKALDTGYPADEIRQRYALSNLLKDPRVSSRLDTSGGSRR